MTFEERILISSLFVVGRELVSWMERSLRSESGESRESVGGALIGERLGIRH